MGDRLDEGEITEVEDTEVLPDTVDVCDCDAETRGDTLPVRDTVGVGDRDGEPEKERRYEGEMLLDEDGVAEGDADTASDADGERDAEGVRDADTEADVERENDRETVVVPHSVGAGESETRDVKVRVCVGAFVTGSVESPETDAVLVRQGVAESDSDTDREKVTVVLACVEGVRATTERDAARVGLTDVDDVLETDAEGLLVTDTEPEVVGHLLEERLEEALCEGRDGVAATDADFCTVSETTVVGVLPIVRVRLARLEALGERDVEMEAVDDTDMRAERESDLHVEMVRELQAELDELTLTLMELEIEGHADVVRDAEAVVDSERCDEAERVTRAPVKLPEMVEEGDCDTDMLPE